MEARINAAKWLHQVREERPLVHNITNVVVTNVVANALLSIGASPVMAYAIEEVADMARIASSLALNMGTLDSFVVESMVVAGRAANRAGTPVLFDPVGVGATPYRNKVAAQVVDELHVDVLRGNHGEIGFLLNAGGEVQGVDSMGAGSDLPRAMQAWAKEHNNVVVATGPVDYVAHGNAVYALHNGHSLLSAITGSGCQVTGILGAFCGVLPSGAAPEDYAQACVAALTCFNIAGEIAANASHGPGSFQANLFDALYNLDTETITQRARIEVVGD